MGTNTTQKELYLPSINETNWGEEINTNFSILDRDYIDIEEKYGLVVGSGASATEQENNADALNQAFSDNHGGSYGKRLMLPANTVLIRGQTVGLSVSSDTSANLEIFGHGPRGSQIYQQTAGLGVMKFETSTGNLRQLSCHDFVLRGVATTPGYDLELLKVGYSWFRDLVFWTGGGLHVGTSSFQNAIQNCWWLNTDTGSNAVLVDSSSECTLTNPMIGEDAGAVVVSGATLRINGGQMRQWPNNIDTGGHNSMGQEHLVVKSDARLFVRNANITWDQAANLVNINNGIAVLQGNRIHVADEGITTRKLICQATLTSPQYFKFENNTVEVFDQAVATTVQIYDQFSGTEPHDSSIQGNTFLAGTNVTLQIEDTFLKPSNNNVFQENPRKLTTGVS